MAQTPETQAFIDRVLTLPTGPGGSLDDVLQPSLSDETELRRLFATESLHPRLNDVHVGLIDVFGAPQELRTTRARVVNSEEDLSAQYVMPLPEPRRRKDGEPAMASSLEEFNGNWAIFTEGSLSQLTDWSNVVVAGGSVLACLAPLPDSAKTSKRAIRKYYHGTAYPTSDIDLFLYGLSPEQAEVKINQIYEAVRDSIPWDCTCIRTKHTVSIHSQYPYRCIQIVLRLYHSPAEVLAGFDVDAPCCAYDGTRVWANPRAIVAMMRQCNTVDMTRRSPSYEVRLAKYSSRDFEVYTPNLRRADIDPTIYERAISRIQGLARLLVLEKLQDVNSRDAYLAHRRKLRSRPPPATSSQATRVKYYKGDLKSNAALDGLQMNDYDVASLHLPYGPGWDSRRIEKLIYQTDLGMNSPFNPKNRDRRLHRHLAWFGTMTECLDDLCGHCPTPLNDEEKALQQEEDKAYIRGHVQFIETDPGRQTMTGSFHPIDVGEWSVHAYIGDTAKLFKAIVSWDRSTVLQMIQDAAVDVNRRDHVGRTPLHMAVLVKAVDIACDLIDNGARMTARIVDGRTALHLAARLDLPVIVRKLLERSAINAEKVKEEEEQNGGAKERKSEEPQVIDGDGGLNKDEVEDDECDSSSIDDLSPEDLKPKKTEGGDSDNAVIPEDEVETPDVLDVNLADWDLAWPPLFHAIAAGSLPVVDELLAAGADVKIPSKFVSEYQKVALHPLTLAILTEDDDCAKKVVQRLLKAGAVSTTADENLLTIFHRFVSSGRASLVSTILQEDQGSKVALNFPSLFPHAVVHPLVTAVNGGCYPLVAVLLAHGAKVTYTEEDISRAREANRVYRLDDNHLKSTVMPIETALANRDPIVHLLAALGADVNLAVRQGLIYGGHPEAGSTYLDWVGRANQAVEGCLEELRRSRTIQVPADLYFGSADGWKGPYAKAVNDVRRIKATEKTVADQIGQRLFLRYIPSFSPSDNEEELLRFKEYLQGIEGLFISLDAKTGGGLRRVSQPLQDVPLPYHYVRPARRRWDDQVVSSHATPSYDELFQACFDGDNARIQQLCLPKENSKIQTDPLQITAEMTCQNGSVYTPLYVAINKRCWETARLIMAIAVAQYKPEEQDVPVFQTRDIAFDGDESPEDSGSGEGFDGEEKPREINFIDIATRPSTLHTQFSPQRLLEEVEAMWPSKDGKEVHSGTVLDQAILEDDFEAFNHICDLYNILPDDVSMNLDKPLKRIMSSDRPEMLNELIRRTGVGIEVAHSGGGDEHHESSIPGRKVYHGLTVHGKKRKDLASRNDPNARQGQQDDQTLVIKAALNGAGEILKYLHGDRPLAAYQHFASMNPTDPRVQRLQKIPDLPAALPQMLGWGLNILNESPLTAAILGGRLETVKILFSLSPKLMETALHAKIKFFGFTSLLVAVNGRCSPEMFDHLVSLKPLLTETDNREWNIYHLASNGGQTRLIRRMLETLPQDVTKMLLSQQSKVQLNTPLHLAVKASNLEIVQLLAERQNAALTLRNVNGLTPLYSAVKVGAAKIVEVLCKVSPKETLYMENTVGDTIPETATQLDLYNRTHIQFPGNLGNVKELNIHENPARNCQPRQPLGVRSQNVAQLRHMVDMLLADGRLKRGTNLATQLSTFTAMMEAQIAKENSEELRRLARREEPTSGGIFHHRHDHRTTAEHIRKFVLTASDSGIKRDLIHILDVHKSVEGQMPDRQPQDTPETTYEGQKSILAVEGKVVGTLKDLD